MISAPIGGRRPLDHPFECPFIAGFGDEWVVRPAVAHNNSPYPGLETDSQGVLFRQTTLTGEPVKTNRVCLLLFAVFFCLSTLCPLTDSLAQSNAHPDYAHQHKDAQKYQKNLAKQRHKQAKEHFKAPKAPHKHNNKDHQAEGI